MKKKKQEALRQKRAEEAARKKKEAAAKKQAEQEQAQEALKGEEQDQPHPDQPEGEAKSRRARVAKGHELSETDPVIFHELRSSTLVSPTIRFDSLDSFVTAVASDPEILVVARLKKATFKKVLSAP